nr:MAG: RNA-dependent RNA polymerase [Botourmiaviridae sp.]
MGAAFSVEAASVVLVPKSDGLMIDGCDNLSRCHLKRVRQARALRRVLDGLAESCDAPGLRRFMKLIPRVPKVSITNGVDAVSFWENLSVLVKKLANLSPAEVRPLFSSSSPGRRERVSLAFSLSLLGKSLHGPCACYSSYRSLGRFHRSALSRVDDCDPAYLVFCGEMTRRFFRSGWDSSYFSSCSTAVVSSNACQERGRAKFGPLASYSSQKEYLDLVMGVEPVRFSASARFSEVLSAGKVRPLTVTHSSYEVLRPLHKTLYNFITRSPWCLRGSPGSESFLGLLSRDGDFVSVDFENATDNLSVNVAERILGVALSRSRSVPDTIKSAALRSLRPEVVYGPDKTEHGFIERRELSMGQMMGQLLSFPLLCLQTFFFYLWSSGQTNLSGRALRSYDGCVVNGDDLVFRSSDPSSFFSSASSTPSVINQKKTQVSPVFLNINSTLFECRSGSFRSVPFVRPSQYDFELPVGSGAKVREATRWLAPRSGLQRRTFSWFMRQSVDICRRFGWSFSKAGFFGQKQVSWLTRRKLLTSHEAEVFSRTSEGPVPREASVLEEPMLPVPSSLSWVPRWALDELTGLYTAFSRFRDLPEERERWNLEVECKKDRLNLPALLRADALRVQKVSRMGFNPPSRFPLPVGSVIYRDRKALISAVRSRLLERPPPLSVLPAGLLSWLGSSRSLTLRPFCHDLLIWRFLQLSRRVAKAAERGLSR